MASNTRVLSGGTTYYMAGGSSTQTVYAGSGTPWTAQTTTPYELSLNDVTGNIWTPQAAASQAIYGGGPPFRIGQSLVTKSYGNVTETVGVQMRATTHDNAVVLLRQLRQILNTALYSSPAILAVQPNGATNTTYFEIYSADVQELPNYIAESNSSVVVLRAAITWTRSIGSAGALTTLVNAQTIQNRSSGSPDNLESLGSLAGDLVNEGQPLNVRITPAASSAYFGTAYIAVVDSRVNTSVVDSETTTTEALFSGTPVTIAVTNARNSNLKIRILGRFDTFTNPTDVRLRIEVYGSGGNVALYSSPTVPLLDAGASSNLIDFGFIDIGPVRSVLTSSLSIDVRVYISSADGSSVTARLDYIETLLYYTFARLTGVSGVGETIVIEQANDYNVNSIFTPNATPRIYDTASNAVIRSITWRGTLPLAYSGASLWFAWHGALSADSTHDTADQATLTVQHLPLYYTLRGGA